MLWLKLIHVHKRGSRRHCNLLKAISKYILHRRACRNNIWCGNHTVITAISYKHHGISFTGKLTVCSSFFFRSRSKAMQKIRVNDHTWAESIVDWWSPLTKGQLFGYRLRVMPSSLLVLSVVCIPCHNTADHLLKSNGTQISPSRICWYTVCKFNFCRIFFSFKLFGRNRSCSCCNGKWLLNILLCLWHIILQPGAPFTDMVLPLIPAWISNCIHKNMWDEVTYPFPNFNGTTLISYHRLWWI